MLIQGTNAPITVVFDESVENLPVLAASLWTNDEDSRKLKEWQKSDMTISGASASLPLTEEETRDFPDGKVILEIKGVNASGKTVFWQETKIKVKARRDKVIDIVG